MPSKLKEWLRHRWVNCLLISSMSALAMVALQYTGVLQNLELRAYDQLLLKRPVLEIDNRIVLISETESDIRRYGHPLSDSILAEALQKIEAGNARVIGVDKYRDMPVAPGTAKLSKVLKKFSNIVWIFFAGNSEKEFVASPVALKNDPERTGFNDMLEDYDGVSRRGLLFLELDGSSYYAFPLLLTLHYLAGEHIAAGSDELGNLSLSGISLLPINSNFGGYRNVDAGGYQIMLDYPGLPQSFRFFSLSELLDNKTPPDALKDKIVLIGGMAPSLSDYKLLPNQIKKYGIEHHAYFVSQLLNTALKQKQPLHSWSTTGEYLWLLAWCLVGALIGNNKGGWFRLSAFIILALLILSGSCLVIMTEGWWIPLVMPLFGWANTLTMSLVFFSSQERAERRQLMHLFASHVSPEIAAKLWEGREQFFSDGGVRPDTLTATVLFTDICNFTTVAETMEPLTLMKWLNEYMGEMSEIVTNNQGMVNKYIGDAIMAIFGVPVKRETITEIAMDAQNAVQCAIQFNQCLRELNEQWLVEGLPVIKMRVGIYTGPLVAGSFGGAVRMEYTVIGDTVNTAARLESFDKTIAEPTTENPCRILIGETTYHHISHLYETKMVGEYQLKGKHEFSKIYQIIIS